MALRETISKWHASMLLVDEGQTEAAITNLCSMYSPSAKILHNIGCLHFLCNRPTEAIESFNIALDKDKYLAITYYQRAFAYLHIKRYDRAELDFLTAKSMTALNGIDYTQLGARVVLTLNHIDDCVQKIRRSYACKNQHDLMAISLEDSLFYPPKKMVDNLVKKDFLGKAKVISSTEEKDIVYGMEKKQTSQIEPERKNPSPQLPCLSRLSRLQPRSTGDLRIPPKPSRPPPRLQHSSRQIPSQHGAPLRRVKSADNVLDSEENSLENTLGSRKLSKDIQSNTLKSKNSNLSTNVPQSIHNSDVVCKKTKTDLSNGNIKTSASADQSVLPIMSRLHPSLLQNVNSVHSIVSEKHSASSVSKGSKSKYFEETSLSSSKPPRPPKISVLSEQNLKPPKPPRPPPPKLKK